MKIKHYVDRKVIRAHAGGSVFIFGQETLPSEWECFLKTVSHLGHSSKKCGVVFIIQDKLINAYLENNFFYPYSVRDSISPAIYRRPSKEYFTVPDTYEKLFERLMSL